tara:strand:+ start:4833 stop:5627 length:795 start_codon:yes stop_codon:yes gene_type:complete
MAETLTFENTQETTSVENLNADEQDSLKVGEAIQEEQDNLLAGKYKDAQELESAYIELQKKLGEKGSEDGEDAGDTDASEQEEGEEDEKETEEDAPEANILDELWEQSGNEKYDEATLEALSKTDPAELAKLHLQYRAENGPKEISDADAKEIKGIVGGDKEYNEMLDWADGNLSEQEIKMFDAVMERGDSLAAFFAVRSLAYRWEDSKGYDGKMLTGTAPKGDGSKFRSQAEVVQAMSDPRYERDPAYRSDIMKKLERSDVNF